MGWFSSTEMYSFSILKNGRAACLQAAEIRENGMVFRWSEGSPPYRKQGDKSLLFRFKTAHIKPIIRGNKKAVKIRHICRLILYLDYVKIQN